ncbi:MAG: S41 family peptidase [Chloroflexota bacterium]
MDKGKRTILTVLLVLLVAFGAYGLGFATPYLTGQTKGASAITQDPNATPGSTANNSGQGGSDLQKPTLPAGEQDINKQFDSFWNTMKVVNDEFYYQPADRQKMIYGAAKGLMQSLGDDFSAFLTPEENQVVQSSMAGNFDGVGMYIERRDNLPTIVAPIPNTPAERAGVRAKDVILAVDGRDVTKMSTDQVASLVRGTAGTKVRITFLRPGQNEPFDVELTREKIEVPAVTFKMLPDGIAHIEVSIFGEKTTHELDAALQQAQDQKARGIILDLRNNGGGLVTSALEMLGRFLPENEIAFYESHKSDGSDDRAQRVISNGPKLLDIPLVVLINGGSASASELTAGALQDYGRAKLIGEQSFGKGSEQHVYTWDDGSSARVTFAHWLTPKKRDINPKRTPTPGPNTPVALPTFTPTPATTQVPAAATATAEAQPLIPSLMDRGLTPDIVVVRTEKDYTDEKDPQLDRAAEYLKTGK